MMRRWHLGVMQATLLLLVRRCCGLGAGGSENADEDRSKPLSLGRRRLHGGD